MLLVTTAGDLSADLIVSAGARAGIAVDMTDYKEAGFEFRAEYDVIYFRDPFNTGTYDDEVIKSKVEVVAKRYPQARYIDQAKSFDYLMIEDKWRQYQRFGKFMPLTVPLGSGVPLTEAVQLAKAQLKLTGKASALAKDRRSSRAKGIFFRVSDIVPGKEYIIQQRLEIAKEYRVYGIHGRIVPLAGVRSSKSAGSRVRMVGSEMLPEDITMFAKEIYRELPYMDLVGFDIAILPDGSPVLLEINRSCQFVGYNRKTGINLADEFMKGILQ